MAEKPGTNTAVRTLSDDRTDIALGLTKRLLPQPIGAKAKIDQRKPISKLPTKEISICGLHLCGQWEAAMLAASRNLA